MYILLLLLRNVIEFSFWLVAFTNFITEIKQLYTIPTNDRMHSMISLE